VIASNEEFPQSAALVYYLVRAGAIAYDIAEVDHTVVGRRNREAGLQGLQIGVDVTEYQNTHRSPGKVAIIDQRAG
jgi:hypothetical protein